MFTVTELNVTFFHIQPT